MSKVLHIVVDVLPDNCFECDYNRALMVSGKDYCDLSHKEITTDIWSCRPDWCQLETEKKCEWKKKDKATDGDYDIYVSPHYPHIYRSNLDFFPPTFCRDCGKKIVYKE